MNTLFHNLLSSSPLWGMAWLAFIFILCFCGIHIAKLAKIGKKHLKSEQKPQEKSEEKSPQNTHPATVQQKPSPSQNAGEPIYYIVERKRRTKSSFGEPKQIKFK